MNASFFRLFLAGLGLSAFVFFSAAHEHSAPEGSSAPNPDAKTFKLDAAGEDSEADDTGKPDKWDVNNPPGDKRDIALDVTEGTWMSLDVSPDGESLVFDLLGDIYIMNARGGPAVNIAPGMAWEIQPRFSPDGKQIAFTSDRAGGDNIWIMDVDGENKTQVTKESFRLLNNPTWSPDGRFIAARKHFTTSRSLGTGEIWIYHVKGGSGVKLVARPSETHQKELGEPMFSPDGRFVYYSQNITSGSRFVYAQDSNGELFQIKSYDMETGDIAVVAGGAGGAVRPAPSPDGRYLAYVKRERAKSKLYIKDLISGRETKIYDNLDQDMQETWAVYGAYPNMDFSPDNHWLYFWSGGEIKRVNIQTQELETIHFHIKDTRQIQKPPRPKYDVAPDDFKTTMPRFAQVSPDGKKIVYESLGKLYVNSTKGGGAPRRLTSLASPIRELDPSWSRSGREIIFATWTDKELGKISQIKVSSGKIADITQEPGHYRRPSLSVDGDYIAYEKHEGGYLTAPQWSNAPGLYVLALEGGIPTRVRDNGSHPHFADDELRVYFTGQADGSAALISTNLLGGDERVHASSKLGQSFHISPDGDMIAFRENYQLYAMPALPGPQNIGTGPDANNLPVRKLSGDGATYPSWFTGKQGLSLGWTLGPQLYAADLATAFTDDDKKGDDEKGDDKAEKTAELDGAIEKDSGPAPILDLSQTLKTSKPTGSIALTNARIITMIGDDGGVIEDGVIVIENDRIAKIGAAADVDIPSDTDEIDLDGKTIMPGLIDAHAHGPQGLSGLTPQQNWSSVAHLAFGVTTIFDPSSSAENIFPASEMQRAGLLLSPRIFSTGEVIYGAKAPGFFAAVNDEKSAAQHVTRLHQQGALGVKNYNQPRREQRQQVTHAARTQNILVVPEGGSLYHMDMSLVVDGNSSIEHNIPVAKIYEDVVQLMSQTDVTYVPTLGVTYGGVRGENYYYQESDVWKHELLSRHVPPALLQARAVRRQMAPEDDYMDDDSAANAKMLMEKGVKVAIGAHGQREGLAAHWEMWTFARGGMSPLQALRTATIDPARHLGMYGDIGSLETGKLADLLILNANPLDDIRATDDIDSVMLGGRLYDAGTMNEIFTGESKRLPYWWE